MKNYIQIGGSRNGIDTYIPPAKARDMKTILIETPSFLDYRTKLGFPKFDQEIAIYKPSDPESVLQKLSEYSLLDNSVFFATYDIYNECAFEVAQITNSLPFLTNVGFSIPNKFEQREKICLKRGVISQPSYFLCNNLNDVADTANSIPYPFVIKPIDSGGGLGVCMVANVQELTTAIATLRKISNYNGLMFSGYIVEGFVEGQEYSIQGVCLEGNAQILTLTKKLILNRTDGFGLNGSTEAAHIAIPGQIADQRYNQITQALCELFEYKNGAFHVDLILSENDLWFLEMGFRPSGLGIQNLVNHYYDQSWPEIAFKAAMGDDVGSLPSYRNNNTDVIGQLLIRDAATFTRAYQLADRKNGITVTENRVFAKTNEKTLNFLKADQQLQSDFAQHGDILGNMIMHSQSINEIYDSYCWCCDVKQLEVAE